jgi:protein TonB
VGAHVAAAAVLLSLPAEKKNEAIAITLAEIKKKNEPPKPPPPPAPPPPPKEEKPKPPPPKPAPASQAKVAVETKAEAPPPLDVGADGFADLGGVALGGGSGDGVAIAGGPAAAAGPAAGSRGAMAAPKATARKVEQLAPAVGNVCSEPIVKPRPKKPGRIKYTKQAQEAEIEGVVRVEVTVDERGKVIAKRVLNGLGYGLDEKALEAADETVFEPATRCGQPVVATKILAFRFGLR